MCGENVCQITDNRKMSRPINFDAIIFDVFYYRTASRIEEIMPKNRHINQRYLFYTSMPARMGLKPPLINENYFNRLYTIQGRLEYSEKTKRLPKHLKDLIEKSQNLDFFTSVKNWCPPDHLKVQ